MIATRKQALLIVGAIVAVLIAAAWCWWPAKPSARTTEALRRHETAVEATKQAETKVEQRAVEVKKGWADTDAKLETARLEAYKTVSSIDVHMLVAGLRDELALIRDERRNMGDAGRQRSNEPTGRGGHTGGTPSSKVGEGHTYTGIARRARRDIAPDNGSGRIQAASTSGEGGVADSYS